ncbi:hypothetical protein O6H91_12G046000 [Diphasiastrum complanatum]|uniref:Uncharacterized protein n=1 Tax=Diphasiastrum complanatum TaxID=34168 RepID=A0ACC2C1A5_DIPCM|nr:hypothetical protein O6H91_12G046000 [Diphasiastrum complanatum]
MQMNVKTRLQLAMQLCEDDGGGQGLPDAAKVAAQCGSWGVNAQLKPYQADGVVWLIRRYVRGVNVILGDEMGLGKTLQSIALLSYLKTQRHRSGPFLVLCPLSVTEGWVSEFAKFAPFLRLMRYVGDKAHREDIRKGICNDVNKHPASELSNSPLPFDVLLTTYELAMADTSFLSRIQWQYAIFDEAQRLKNSSSVVYKLLDEQYMIPRRLLLTGTPIQNNLTEFWALLHFCMPRVFGQLEEFLSYFDTAEIASYIVDKSSNGESDTGSMSPLRLLRQVAQVFMLRRTKAALSSSKALVLPSLSEVTMCAPMVALQRSLYVSILRKELPKIVGRESGSSSNMSLQNIVVQLRKACSHPYLFDGVEPEPFEEGEHLVQASGKLLVLDFILKKLHTEGRRVLIYAQMTRTLDILQDFLEYRRYSYERLDGSVRAEDRFAAVRSFVSVKSNKTDEAFVFLLTTRAGGVGLNLVAADTVIFYEQDWNPQADKQALQRAHRIGQTRPVLAIRLIAESTIEEVIMFRANKKLQLTNEVIGHDSTELDAKESALDSPDIRSMIIYGLHKLTPSQPSSEIGNFSADRDFNSKINKMVEKAVSERNRKNASDVQDAESMKMELMSNENIYTFEGTDFATRKSSFNEAKELETSADRVALESLITNSKDETIETNGRRKRRVLAEDTIETINNNLEEKRAKKLESLKENKLKKWEALGYISLAVVDELEADVGNTSLDEDSTDLHSVVGDCTKPFKHPTSKSSIIFMCVDNSGNWGTGGMFNALFGLSDKIPDTYTAAHAAGAQCSTAQSAENHLLVSLAVVQTYDHRRKVPRSSMSLAAFESCLKKVCASAIKHSGSVHFPRMGARTDEGRKEWYTVERLLRKYTVKSGVPFYVYYYKK